MKMTRWFCIPMIAVLIGCPSDDEPEVGQIPVDSQVAVTDTAPADLSGLRPNIPEAAPDTFTPREPSPPTRTVASREPALPAAPAALMEAAAREQSVSRFCYQELGLKNDPSLAGNVAMVVTVGPQGIRDAQVGDANWSSRAGNAVNTCLAQKARQAWRLAPGAVAPGRYVVRLTFEGM